MFMNEDIISKDKNIETVIYQILNECYYEFKQVYGEKHGQHIKELIESITDKVKKADLYYTGSIATAHSQMGVVYTDSDILSAVLKHEMWHVYNNSASDKDKSLTYIPERYMLKLEQSGYLKNLYIKTMEEYKEKFKDEPERLEYVLVDFDVFKNDKFDFGDSHIEMWTEWFNSQTHLKDMKQNFWDWGDGYFTKSRSSDSFYDAYINIASMIFCMIPKEKLLEMYLQTTEYETEYSFPEMLDEFDERYIDVLETDEKDKYQYPYLKILKDIQTVDENARKNPEMARETLQSCMKTCFNAYLKKLDNIQDLDLNKAKNIYSQIKYMQEHMVWNIDISKMQDLDYIQSLTKVQDKFKTMLQELDLEDPEVQQMLETIDYTAKNPFKYIEDGKKITDRILSAQVNTKDCLISIGDYKAQINTNGIKDNLYSSLFALLGEEKYNLIYENFQGDNSLSAKDNVLLKFHKQIEEATTDEAYMDIYNNMYDLYAQKL